MSDTELTETEAERLRQLLHLAADSLEVTTPDAGRADEEHVGRGLQVAAGRELVDELALDAGGCVVVEVGQCGWGRQ